MSGPDDGSIGDTAVLVVSVIALVFVLAILLVEAFQ